MPRTNKEFELSMVYTKNTLKTILRKPGVIEKISPYGFNLERLHDGLTIGIDTNDTYLNLLSNRAEQVDTGILVAQKFKAVSNKYSLFTANLKIEFHDSKNVIRGLGIEGEKKRTIPSFIAQAINSFTNLLKRQDILDKATVLGITAESLQADLAEIRELEALHARHKFLMGHCQKLTEDRDRKHAELKRYMKQLKNVLFLVYPKGQRKILAELGISIKNPPRLEKNTDKPIKYPIPTDSPKNIIDTQAAKPNGYTDKPAEFPIPTDSPESILQTKLSIPAGFRDTGERETIREAKVKPGKSRLFGLIDRDCVGLPLSFWLNCGDDVYINDTGGFYGIYRLR